MSPSPPAASKPNSLAHRRQQAQKVLWWRSQAQFVAYLLFLGLLLLDIGFGSALVISAARESRSALDLGARLFGDAEEAAWLGWLTYFGWLFFDRMNRARKQRRSARLAHLLLRRGHPRWFHALTA